MRFYHISYVELFSRKPIPTPVLDRLYEAMIKLEAKEQVSLINALNTKSPDNKIFDWEKEQKRLMEIFNPRTKEEKIDDIIKSWKSVFRMRGKEMSKETEDEMRRNAENAL